MSLNSLKRLIIVFRPWDASPIIISLIAVGKTFSKSQDDNHIFWFLDHIYDILLHTIYLLEFAAVNCISNQLLLKFLEIRKYY